MQALVTWLTTAAARGLRPCAHHATRSLGLGFTHQAAIMHAAAVPSQITRCIQKYR